MRMAGDEERAAAVGTLLALLLEQAPPEPDPAARLVPASVHRGSLLVPLVVSGAPYQGPIICALTSLVMVNGAPRR